MKSFKPRPSEEKAIQRMVDKSVQKAVRNGLKAIPKKDKEGDGRSRSFAVYSLYGMLNTAKHIISPYVNKEDEDWFESCIRYMLGQVKAGKPKRKK